LKPSLPTIERKWRLGRWWRGVGFSMDGAQSRIRRNRWVAFWVAGAIFVGLSGYIGGVFAEQGMRRILAVQAKSAAQLHAAVLRSELEKHRSLPFVLAEDREVRAALQNARLAPALNARLEALSKSTRAAVIYILDRHGVTIAASNWRLPTSFVGSNYRFRPYFKNAMEMGTAEHFLLGTVSLRPGLYLARRVDGAEPLGAVVVKVEFDSLEEEWRRSGEPAFVTDEHGAVLVTSVPNWRFASVVDRTPGERAKLNAVLQFGADALRPLPMRAKGQGEVELSGGDLAGRYIQANTAVATPGWTLHLLQRSDRELNSAVVSARVTVALLAILLFISLMMFVRWRERAAFLAAAQEASRQLLEDSVAERTSELREANGKLTREMEERRRAEANLLAMQDGLAQANKFVTLGHIAAGVAHEINQPVAAIRTYADNAILMLDRKQIAPSQENLRVIASLTERIGLITDELREFSRKSRGRVVPTSVDDVVAGALLLTNWRVRQQKVELRREPGPQGVMVQAERTRLEQVLVNLLQNALEALDGKQNPKISIAVQLAGRRVRILVSDNGAGVDAVVAANLFTPFATTKPKGLGLGLVISRDIAAEFGGELLFQPLEDGGAEFTVSLRRA
jgi:two-component system, NtrC family, C4-dicarboxylate transport sensor histidine kinase DctB